VVAEVHDRAEHDVFAHEEQRYENG